jgi:DNA-directed RNA polymerase subunit K/omega
MLPIIFGVSFLDFKFNGGMKMPARTQNIDKILEISDNLFEAVMVIARRARQINEEYYQKKRDHQILEELEGGFDDDYLNAEEDEAEAKPVVEPDENPITHAQNDFMDQKLDYQYESMRR